MICRNCGTEIADKAIVCYRCGTGTTEPVRKPAEIRRKRSPAVLMVVFVIALLLALYLAWSYYAPFTTGLEITTFVEVRNSTVLIDLLALHA